MKALKLKAPYPVFSHSRHSKHSILSLCTCPACLQPPKGIHACMHACEMTGGAEGGIQCETEIMHARRREGQRGGIQCETEITHAR